MTGDDRRDRIWERFEQALDQPIEARRDWLREVEPDPDVRAEVEGLLDGHEAEGGLLDRPPPLPPSSDEETLDADDDATMEARVRAVFEGTYGLVRELGRGGMSRVYLAWERKHQRRVVLKVLRPEVAAGSGAERFSREARLVARLSHPNVVPLIDSGVKGDLAYYVMPYIDGLSLRERLRGVEAGLPMESALAVLRDVAKALDFAHVSGVVHRDLKPDNVLLAGPHAYLFDFGVARARSGADGTPAGTALTRDGAFLGTPGYAAPEQLWGATSLDHRADLWAWGVLAWEVFTGELPPNPANPLDAGSTAYDEGLLARRPEVPEPVAAIVARCLQLEPARRPESAADLLDALGAAGRAGPRSPHPESPGASRTSRWVAAGVGVVAVGATAALLLRGGDTGVAPATEGALGLPVAVAPFEATGGDPGLTLLGRFAGDWVTQGIQDLDGLEVVPWPASVGAAADRQPTEDVVAAVVRGTGAGTVIVGSVYDLDGRLRFRAEVVDAATGLVVSAPEPVATSPDSSEAALQTLVDRIRSSLAIAGDERLSAIPGLARDPPTFEAYRAFDQGLELYLAQDYAEATTAFQTAWSRDTTFHSALVYAAATAMNTGDLERADEVLDRVEPHLASLGAAEQSRWEAMRAVADGDSPRALRAMARLADSGPASRAPYNFALLALSMNRPADALAALEAADPDRGEMKGWAQYWTQLAHARHLLGDYDGEAAAAAEMRRRHPERRVALVLEVRARAAQGRMDEVARLLDLAETMAPETYWSAGGAAVVAAEAARAHGHEGWEPLLARGERWLDSRLASAPDHGGHRYWRASADYDARRWTQARARFEALLSDEPDSDTYRGMAALSAAHAGDVAAAEALLEAPFPGAPGEHTAYRARLAALQGDADEAAALLALALEQGVGGWAWIPASGFDDFAPVSNDPRIARMVGPEH
ncbi:serine/threonine-protein kinase [Gaopeijia maritima]|uniref:serine/threonine-protein kinase n=1 Tax=Gaopeijia maritima TaxID=3119007 RepID=UPI00327EF460